MSMKWSMEDLLHNKKAKKMLQLLTVSALVFTAGCSLLPAENEEEELPVINPPQLSQRPEYTVMTETIETRVRGVGKLMSTEEEELFFIEDGKRIQEIYVEVGSHVEEGQLIAELDVTDLENELRQKRLQMRGDELQMIMTLRNADEMSAEEFEQAQIAFELKRTELLELEESINRSKLIAPQSGTVVTMSMRKGDLSKAYEQVAVIANLSQLTVAATISGDDRNKIAPGMEAIVDINAAGQHLGVVKQLPEESSNNNNRPNDPWNPNPQPQRDSIENYVTVELNEFPDGLIRGTPLSVSIIVNRKEDVVVIPPSALRTHAGRSYVQVVDEEGNRREVDVEVGQQTPTMIEIVNGLEPGQKVVGR